MIKENKSYHAYHTPAIWHHNHSLPNSIVLPFRASPSLPPAEGQGRLFVRALHTTYLIELFNKSPYCNSRFLLWGFTLARTGNWLSNWIHLMCRCVHVSTTFSFCIYNKYLCYLYSFVVTMQNTLDNNTRSFTFPLKRCAYIILK